MGNVLTDEIRNIQSGLDLCCCYFIVHSYELYSYEEVSPRISKV